MLVESWVHHPFKVFRAFVSAVVKMLILVQMQLNNEYYSVLTAQLRFILLNWKFIFFDAA